MNFKYISKIKANLSIHTNKKTSNILEGSYNSIYRGRSMNFQDLREYVVGDNIKDIDWRASSRVDKILVKQYVAEKKHNILFIFDSGKKMLADTLKADSKKDVAVMTAGTIGYLVDKNGDSIGAISRKNEGIQYFPFRTGLLNLDRILNHYDKEIDSENNLDELINYVFKTIKRKMIIFVISDLEGISSVKEDTLKKISSTNDVLFINISDALLSGGQSFDMDQDKYISDFILNDKKMVEMERSMKKEQYENEKDRLIKYRIVTTSIDDQGGIVNEVLKLLERRKNANIY